MAITIIPTLSVRFVVPGPVLGLGCGSHRDAEDIVPTLKELPLLWGAKHKQTHDTKQRENPEQFTSRNWRIMLIICMQNETTTRSKASCPALGGGLSPSVPTGFFPTVSLQSFASRQQQQASKVLKKNKK